MKLSLIIPCYNEEGNILPLYEKVRATFDGVLPEYEFVYVNDGSSDQTGPVLRQLAEETDALLRVVNFSRNFGKEAAILAGLREATGDLLCLMDGDLQQSPEVVLSMIRYLEDHPDCDCVTAVQESRDENPLMVFFKDSFYKIINLVTDTHFEPNASDFRTFRRSMADVITALPEKQRFSKGIFAWIGFQTHYIPYTADERLTGTSKWGFVKLMKYAIDGILSYTVKPLKFALGAGAVSTVAAVFSLGRKTPAGKALVLGTSGVQLLCLGILGEYVARLYTEALGRPVYIIKDVLHSKGIDD